MCNHPQGSIYMDSYGEPVMRDESHQESQFGKGLFGGGGVGRTVRHTPREE
jgi:hypothetical protein